MQETSNPRLAVLLKEQHDVLTMGQALTYGLSSSAVSRRVASGRWQRLLPRVYLTSNGQPGHEQRVWAAVLYGGEPAALTGMAALRRHRIRRLPSLPALPIQVACWAARQPASRDFVTVQRTMRPAAPYLVNGLRTMPVPRAVIDVGPRLSSYEEALELVTAVLHAGRATLEQLVDELLLAPRGGSRWLRLALAETGAGSRSVAEAEARRLFAAAGFPPPAVNESILVGGQLFVPDFRWGWVIVEIDSKEWHLLHPGSWEATLRRRAELEAAGYHVIPVSPTLVRESPQLLLAQVRTALVQYLAWPA
jgi:hypothetical protein